MASRKADLVPPISSFLGALNLQEENMVRFMLYFFQLLYINILKFYLVGINTG